MGSEAGSTTDGTSKVQFRVSHNFLSLSDLIRAFADTTVWSCRAYWIWSTCLGFAHWTPFWVGRHWPVWLTEISLGSECLRTLERYLASEDADRLAFHSAGIVIVVLISLFVRSVYLLSTQLSMPLHSCRSVVTLSSLGTHSFLYAEFLLTIFQGTNGSHGSQYWLSSSLFLDSEGKTWRRCHHLSLQTLRRYLALRRRLLVSSSRTLHWRLTSRFTSIRRFQG